MPCRPLKRPEAAQRHGHGPPLGRAVRAVLGADVEHLGLAAGGQHLGRADRGHALGVGGADTHRRQGGGRHAVMSLITLAGRAVPVAESAPAVFAGGEFWVVLTRMKATTITMTPRMAPPVSSIRLRISRLRWAARCAAILSRAFSRLTLVALPMSRPMNGPNGGPARLHRRRHQGMRLPRSWAEDGWIDPFPAAQAAIWAREVKPSFDRIFATWRAAVAGLITSSSAMPLLLYPRAISAVISRSRGVSDDRGVTRGTHRAPRPARPGRRGQGTRPRNRPPVARTPAPGSPRRRGSGRCPPPTARRPPPGPGCGPRRGTAGSAWRAARAGRPPRAGRWRPR